MKTIRNGIILALVVLLVFPPRPQPAHALFGAGDLVTDIITNIKTGISAVADVATAAFATSGCNVKECALDPLAWLVTKAAVASLTRSMVNWINSGFNGSPAFVTNLQVTVGNIGFATENSFINQLSMNPAIRSPFQSQVASLLNVNYLRSSASNGYFLSNPYTLDQVSSNPEGFVNGSSGFSGGGGWNAWFALTTQPQNNVYGAYNLAQNELNLRISVAQNNLLTQLGWGQGFLSWCDTSASGPVESTSAGGETVNIEGGGSLTTPTYQNPDAQLNNIQNSFATVNASAPNNAQICTNNDGTAGTIKTPGSVIQDQLNKTLGLSGDSLVTADEFGEVIGALMGQLVNQVVGPSGLSGAASVSSGGRGYVDRAASQQAAITSTSAGSAGASISNAISGQLQQVTDYQNNWQTIGNAANAASASLASCSAAPSGAAAAVSSAQSQASAGTAKANAGIAALSQVRNEISAAGSDPTASAKVSADYQALISSPTIPSGSDIAFAATQSQDNSAGATAATSLSSLTLDGQMQFIISRCSGANR